MSSLTRKKDKKQEQKDYKTLYETELNNRKLYEQRYKEIHRKYIELQNSSGIAELRKENLKLTVENDFLKDNAEKLYQDKIKQLKEENARLRIELEDLKGFKEQDEQYIKVLKGKIKRNEEMEGISNE